MCNILNEVLLMGLGLWDKLTKKTNVLELDQNWRGSGPGEHPKKIGTPYVFLQPLKLATSNLVHNLGLGLAYQKTMIWTTIGGGLGQGSIRKKLALKCTTDMPKIFYDVLLFMLLTIQFVALKCLGWCVFVFSNNFYVDCNLSVFLQLTLRSLI